MPLALIGYATRFREIVTHNGKRAMLLPGVFNNTLESGATVKLYLNHFDHQCCGSTQDDLDLYSDGNIGLSFRYRIRDTEDGRYVRSMAEFGNNCMSIGWDRGKTDVRLIDGEEVTCVSDARLYEISFLHGIRTGLVKEAFATLAESDYSKSLRDECAGGKLLYEGAAVGVSRALQDLANTEARREPQH